MAISPSEAKKRLLQTNEATISAIEQRIDECLAQGIRDISIPHLNAEAHGELLRRYRVAGWHVKSTYDQREGNYWHFQDAEAIRSER